jgi:hypothetical protein
MVMPTTNATIAVTMRIELRAQKLDERRRTAKK